MKMLHGTYDGSRSEVKRRPHKQLHINPINRRSWPMAPSSPLRLKVRNSLMYVDFIATCTSV